MQLHGDRVKVGQIQKNLFTIDDNIFTLMAIHILAFCRSFVLVT